MAKKTKNDRAWEAIFEEHNILYYIEEQGFYEILASDIKKHREPRLMCKFDHENNLPDIFINNNLSILPISRSAYVIGNFSLFAKVDYENIEPKELNIPHHIETLNATDLYSESSALHFAYNSGMIDDFLGEETKQTVSGRMGSGKFTYNVSSKEGHVKFIEVEGAQVEIDGGYEGQNKFALVEAKKEKASDFNVRQLFYPYRVWKNRVNKDIIPIFFTHSNDKFSFFMYEFKEENTFNSFELVKQKDYIVPHEKITQEDVDSIVNNATTFVDEPEIPFPQADTFIRVIDLLGNLYNGDISKEEITTLYDFDKRQSDYYGNSCVYLGLAYTYRIDNEVMISLNDEGKRVMELPFRQKYLTFVEKILNHQVFKEVYDEYVKNNKQIDNHFIVERMRQNNLYNINSETTYYRRASTIRGWIKWIYNLPNK
ncbi:type II restriction enzyme [Alkalibacillus sp. S2W]|uniref:type II restriction enzyme n=1 Tax=Alkalibacillus sp. S2W TaxID=3386553 RepID=UPI00398CD294